MQIMDGQVDENKILVTNVLDTVHDQWWIEALRRKFAYISIKPQLCCHIRGTEDAYLGVNLQQWGTSIWKLMLRPGAWENVARETGRQCGGC